MPDPERPSHLPVPVPEMSARAVLDAAHEAFIAISADDRIIDWNRQAELTFGWTRDEALGRSLAETIIPPRHRTAHLAGMQRFLRTGEGPVLNKRLELTAIDRDGREFPVELTISALRIGERPIFSAFVHDISERYEAAEQIKRLSRHNELILNFAGEGIYGLDTEGRTTFVNPAAARMTGWEPHELIGKNQHDVLHHTRADGAPYPCEQCPIYAALKDGTVHRVDDEVFWRKDGTSFPVRYTSTPIFADGRIVGAVVIFDDITEQKEAAEEMARQARELARSNAELEQFAYVASHDLQEPLRMVASYTQLLARRYADKLGPEADEFIHYAVDGAQRMQTLINDLLAFSRVGTRGQPFRPTPLQGVVETVTGTLRIAIAEAGARVEVVGDLPTVTGDAIQLQQLFQNLISNAIKFARPGVPPVVTISARRQEGDAGWQICLKDNGIGIAPEHHERIFVIFQRLHTRDQYPGTGIGLAICRKIVERHGGKLWVESQGEGDGSAFCFTFPDDPEEAQ